MKWLAGSGQVDLLQDMGLFSKVMGNQTDSYRNQSENARNLIDNTKKRQNP